ncbi:hypothetical protein, partial [Yersinia pestis]|uniref:hypothetical protein n=1 Tax=Yersinia pestis TaxID=632 RepID=UPI001EE6B5D7
KKAIAASRACNNAMVSDSCISNNDSTLVIYPLLEGGSAVFSIRTDGPDTSDSLHKKTTCFSLLLIA